jgi:small GTP-binding protein
MENNAIINDDYPVTHAIKLIVVGNSNVGKSMYTYRCNSQSSVFYDTSQPTIGLDFSVRTIPHPTDAKARVRITTWDTAGQERFDSIVRGYFRDMAGVIFIYDLASLESLDAIKRRWVPMVVYGKKESAEDCEESTLDGESPMFESILIGNKRDLVKPDGPHERAISYEDANNYATDVLGIPYVECSCKTGSYEELNTPIAWLVSLILKNRRLAASLLIPLSARPEHHGGSLRVVSASSTNTAKSKSDGGCCS